VYYVGLLLRCLSGRRPDPSLGPGVFFFFFYFVCRGGVLTHPWAKVFLFSHLDFSFSIYFYLSFPPFAAQFFAGAS
jgi:hypothetical protein